MERAVEKMDALCPEKFLMFENEKNNCWLHAALSLIIYNKTFKKIVHGSSTSRIKSIIDKYEDAIKILNDTESDKSMGEKVKIIRESLNEIQNMTLQYLQQFLKYKEGEPDSAFCALFNLINQDKSDIKKHLSASWSWIKHCTNCGSSSKYDPQMKPIITLSKVKSFQPECPTSLYICACKAEQEMKLVYKLLPPCIIFHFENGAGNGQIPLLFSVEDREYHLTAIVVLEKSIDPQMMNHFVTYIREPTMNMWLDCNDLNTTVMSFSNHRPEFALQDICIYVFEAFDNLGKITNTALTDFDQNMEHLHVECIDLADEVEEVKWSLENAKDTSSNYSLGDKKESSLTSEENLSEYSFKNESKDKNKAVSVINLPVKTAIIDRCNFYCDNNMHSIDESKNKEKNDLKADCSAGLTKPTDEKKSKSVDSNQQKKKEDAFLDQLDKNSEYHTQAKLENEELLKVKGNESKASTSNITVDVKNEASNSDSMEGISTVKCNVRKSVRLSSKPKRVRWRKTHEPEEVATSSGHAHREPKPKKVDKKIEEIINNISEPTLAAFFEQLLMRQGAL